MNPPKLPTTLAPNASALFDTHGTLTVLFITQWMNVMGEISKAEGLSHLAAPVIATLRNLVRDHLLHFRLEVGRGVRAPRRRPWWPFMAADFDLCRCAEQCIP